MGKYLLLSWEDLYNETLKLYERIKKSGYNPDIIIGIARGGWVIARILSDLMLNPNILSIRITFYEKVGRRGKKPILLQDVNVDMSGLKVLIVDDVVDTGETMSLAVKVISSKKTGEIRTAVLHKKPWSKFKPDYYVREVKSWIIYPYEYKETMRDIAHELLEKGYNVEDVIQELIKAGFNKKMIKMFLSDILE